MTEKNTHSYWTLVPNQDPAEPLKTYFHSMKLHGVYLNFIARPPANEDEVWTIWTSLDHTYQTNLQLPISFDKLDRQAPEMYNFQRTMREAMGKHQDPLKTFRTLLFNIFQGKPRHKQLLLAACGHFLVVNRAATNMALNKNVEIDGLVKGYRESQTLLGNANKDIIEKDSQLDAYEVACKSLLGRIMQMLPKGANMDASMLVGILADSARIGQDDVKGKFEPQVESLEAKLNNAEEDLSLAQERLLEATNNKPEEKQDEAIKK